jgi:hypothetical protein
VAGTVPGAVIGGVLGLFSSSEEDERQRRRQEALKAIRKAYAERRQAVGHQAQSARATAAMSAGRRAAAMGSPSATEALYLPSEANVNEQMTRAMTELESQEAAAEANLEMEFAQRPMEPSLMETALEAGAGYAQFEQGQKLGEKYDKYLDEIIKERELTNKGLSRLVSDTSMSDLSVSQPSFKRTPFELPKVDVFKSLRRRSTLQY